MSLELLSLTENAFKTQLLSQVTAITNIYTGKGNEDKEPPCIVIEAGDAEEYVPETGNYLLQVDVSVRYRPGTDSTSLATANTGATEVLTCLWADDLQDSLTTAQSDFTCFGITTRSASQEVLDDVWVSRFKLSIICCPSDLA